MVYIGGIWNEVSVVELINRGLRQVYDILAPISIVETISRLHENQKQLWSRRKQHTSKQMNVILLEQ